MAQLEDLIRECKRQEESCQYTSTALYGWLAAAQWQNRAWNALPIACGALASFAVLAQALPVVAGFLAMLAGLLPAIYDKLGIQAHTDDIAAQAGAYKNLENRFRQAAEIISADGAGALKAELERLMQQIEVLRAKPLMIPPKHFEAGRAKIKSGHYEPDKATITAAGKLAKKVQGQN